MEAFDSKGIKVLRQPWNALTLQLPLSLRDRYDLVYFASLFCQEHVSLVSPVFSNCRAHLLAT